VSVRAAVAKAAQPVIPETHPIEAWPLIFDFVTARMKHLTVT